MAGLVERLVIVAWLFPVRFRRDDGFYFGGLEPLDDPFVRIIALVGDQNLRLDPAEQNVGAIQVAGLPWRQMKPERISQCIAERVNLCAQAAA